MSYDSANYTVTRELCQAAIAGASSATMAKFLLFQQSRLRAVHALVTTAGTNTAAGFDAYVGTASVGAVTFGTNTAGSVVTSGLINAIVPQNGVVELKGKANSATAVITAVLEYIVDSDSTQT